MTQEAPERTAPSSKQLQSARKIKERDEHALINVERALANGATLAELDLTKDELQQARIIFLRFCLGTLLFEGKHDHLRSPLAAAYIHLRVVRIGEVSQYKGHEAILVACGERVVGATAGPFVSQVDEVRRSIQNVPPPHQP